MVRYSLAERTSWPRRDRIAAAKPGKDTVHLSRPELATKMKAIIMESDGLQRMMASGEMDALTRYRHLLGEFLELMRADVEADAEALESTSE